MLSVKPLAVLSGLLGLVASPFGTASLRCFAMQESATDAMNCTDQRILTEETESTLDSSATSPSSSPKQQQQQQMVDPEYPGTAVERMLAIRERARKLTSEQLSGDWDSVRVNVLTAGGLRDLRSARPGAGYTGHSFNDYNHCDLTAMQLTEFDSTNDGQVAGIAIGNRLGSGIRVASYPELGPGGSWSTCMIGCASDPPRDVAHLQFRSRIAFKLVWVPPEFETFVLVDDAGELLNVGHPDASSPGFPSWQQRAKNYAVVRGSKYATAADTLSSATKSPGTTKPAQQ